MKVPLSKVMVESLVPSTVTVARKSGAPVSALVTVPVTVPVVGSGLSAIVPAEMDDPATTVTVRVVEVKPAALIVRVCGPWRIPLRVKFPLLSVVVEKPVPLTVALGRGAPVSAFVTVPVTVPVVGSGVSAIVPAETDALATTVTAFVVLIKPDALTVRVWALGGRHRV